MRTSIVSRGARVGAPAALTATSTFTLGYHEVVNDELDGRAVAVTWCPICWSAAVYGRRVDGRTLMFGVSGKLADDALVFYDRETGSLWKQPTGKCIAGRFEADDAARAYPVGRVEAAGGVVTDTVGDLRVAVFATDGGVHAFEHPGYEFAPAGNRVRADGARWDPVTGESDDGRRLDRLPARQMFAFAWQEAHGLDAFYDG
ncbi:MAG: DUF3179 domain-containing (seleno)protein [Haloarculaceae archaeon]